MSWTMLLMKLNGGVRPIDQFDERDVRPLGTASEVRAALSIQIPALQWLTTDFCRFQGDGFGMEFNIHKGEPVQVIGPASRRSLRRSGDDYSARGGDVLGGLSRFIRRVHRPRGPVSIVLERLSKLP